MLTVNRVLTCTFEAPLSLDECQQRADSLNLHTKLYTYRPHMLCIRYSYIDGACTLILFSSGKARYMGREEAALHHLLQLEPFIINSQRLTPLWESTRTVRLQVDAPPSYLPLQVREFPKGCLWEPELFPAIQFQQWYPVCVNLFHTGVAMVLGRTSDLQLTIIHTVLTEFVHKYCVQH